MAKASVSDGQAVMDTLDQWRSSITPAFRS
jgi:hypothetical protein